MPHSQRATPRLTGPRCQSRHRNGSVLVLVLVVVALLSLGAYTFAELMLVEAQATSAFGREAQARAMADSGVELAAGLLVDRALQDPESYRNNAAWFQGVLLRQSENAKGRGRFSVVSPLESDTTGTLVRYGLMDESAKLNINSLMKLGLSNEALRQSLMYIPEMTEEIADAILDWIDTDQTVREVGAEDETYSAASPPYKAKNGPIDALDELLLVRGVTPWLLFGEDANRNGLLDPEENDGGASPPLDNADGMLNRGWAAYLTVHGRETNLTSEGLQRINLNMNALADLYDQLVPVLDEDKAKFIIAYRMAGAKQAQSSGSGGSSGSSSGGAPAVSVIGGGVSVTNAQDVSGQLSTNGGTITTAQDVGAGQGVTTFSQNQGVTNIQQNQGVQNVAQAVSSAISMVGQSKVTRAGIDVTSGGKVQVNSLYDLVGVQVQVEIDGSKTTLDSPWTGEPSALKQDMAILIDKVSTKADRFIEGRINVNEARPEVLMGLPNMTQTIVDAIIAGQSSGSQGGSLAGQVSDRATTAWLVAENIVDLATMRQLDKYLTARGDVFRLQSVGFFDEGGPVARVEAVIDGTQDPPAIVFQRDLTDLGRGFSKSLLLNGGSGK